MKRLIALFILLSVFVSVQAYAAMQLAGVRAGQHADKVRLVFDLRGGADYRISALHGPERVLLRFPTAKKGLRFARKALNMGWVKRIRTGRSRGGYIVVIDLVGKARFRYFLLKGRHAGEKRLVVDIYKPETMVAVRKHKKLPSASSRPVSVMPKQDARADQKAATVKKPETSVARKPARAKPAVKKPVGLAEAASRPQRKSSSAVAARVKKPAASQSKSERGETARRKQVIQDEILRFTSRPLDDNEIIVAIDAGHGGKDTGAIGPGGVREKDVTLDMARALKRRIDAEPGMRAVLIRKGDEFVPLYERPKLARKYNADLFISIHADAFPHDRSVRGGSIYVLNEKGASSAMARALADSENGSIFLSARKAPEKVAYVLGDLTRKANLQASRKLASAVLQEMARKVRMHKLSVQSANFAVLRSLDMPSILIETAFISNPQDIRNLRSRRFRAQMAEAIVKGVRRFAAKRARQPHWGETLFVHYRVKRGDTLSEIAKRFGTRVSTLKRINRLRSADRLYVGKRLKVPVSEKLLASI